MDAGEAADHGTGRAGLAAAAPALGRAEPRFAALVAAHGLPEPRVAPRGLAGLLRAIVGQQLSIHAASRIWERLVRTLCDPGDPDALLAAAPEALRAAGLSAAKIAHARGLAEAIRSGRLDLDRLPTDDAEAAAAIASVRGIGRWTAEIYLLFSERRPDVLPAGDLALRLAAGRLFGLEPPPAEAALRAMAAAWSPWRGAAAHLLWHAYRLPPV